MFLKHFASKNQLPGFFIGGTLVENGLILSAISIQYPNFFSFIFNMASFHIVEKEKSPGIEVDKFASLVLVPADLPIS